MSRLLDALAEGPLVLDGGLGTLLEERGQDVSNELWSARLLFDDPESVVAAHREFFDAGARVAVSASYQASFEGFARAGIDAADGRRLMGLSIELARRAAEESGGSEKWVAASVGPFGAALADGSEYRGNYGKTIAELAAWHKPRLRVLQDAEADLLAVETIPALAEVEAIARALDGSGAQAWLSVTAGLGTTRAGEPLREAFQIAEDTAEIVAVGINCCFPGEVLGAISAARTVTDKPIVVYPNSGEEWDAKHRSWMGAKSFPSDVVAHWVRAGASLIGGCCRVGPDEIRAISEVVTAASAGTGPGLAAAG